jgi:pimeloyl-ACP methyl ester carboxylesterase
MHYIDEGQGDPVVMVHGNPTWSFYYRDLARALKDAGHRVIAMDHVGMGLSDKPSDARYEYTLRNRLRDVERLLSSLELGPVTLVVHDWGGAIGLGWALRDPARVKALVITNTAAFLPGPEHRLPWQLSLARGGLGAGLTIPAMAGQLRSGARRVGNGVNTTARQRVDRAFLDDWRLATANGPQAQRMYAAGTTLEVTTRTLKPRDEGDEGGGNVR